MPAAGSGAGSGLCGRPGRASPLLYSRGATSFAAARRRGSRAPGCGRGRRRAPSARRRTARSGAPCRTRSSRTGSTIGPNRDGLMFIRRGSDRQRLDVGHRVDDRVERQPVLVTAEQVEPAVGEPRVLDGRVIVEAVAAGDVEALVRPQADARGGRVVRLQVEHAHAAARRQPVQVGSSHAGSGSSLNSRPGATSSHAPDVVPRRHAEPHRPVRQAEHAAERLPAWRRARSSAADSKPQRRYPAPNGPARSTPRRTSRPARSSGAVARRRARPPRR